MLRRSEKKLWESSRYSQIVCLQLWHFERATELRRPLLEPRNAEVIKHESAVATIPLPAEWSYRKNVVLVWRFLKAQNIEAIGNAEDLSKPTIRSRSFPKAHNVGTMRKGSAVAINPPVTKRGYRKLACYGDFWKPEAELTRPRRFEDVPTEVFSRRVLREAQLAAILC